MKVLFATTFILVATFGVAIATDHDDDDYYGHGRGQYPGSRYGSHYPSRYHYKRPRILCPKLPDPANGDVNVTGRYPGQKAIYSCNEGYQLVGFATRSCSRNGKWSGEAPICKRIDCGPLPHIANGQVSIAPDTRLGSTATYICISGYNLVGEETRTCEAEGWSGKEPVCEPVNCGDLDDPENGWVHIAPDTLLGAVALYRCKLGYQLSSDDERTCQANGQWSGSAPTCDPIDCGTQPTADPNGKIDSTEGTSLGDKTTYSCNTGYYLVGTETIYCQNDKSYSDEAPKCELVDCGAPDPADPNGSLQFTTTTFQSKVVYSCNAGYTLNGQSMSVCQASGEWSSEAPTCEPVDCGSLPAPKFGGVTFYPGTTVTSTATFRCKKGFRLVGSEVRTCGTNGKWTGKQPVCQKIKCPKLAAPQYGKVFVSGQHPGDYAYYRCGYGYSLKGNRRRVCLHNGNWSGSDSSCTKDDDHYGGYGGYKDHEY